MTTTIHFVRHGNVHNPDKILYGRLPHFKLSELGIEQAQAAAEYFAARPITAVYSSPMLRARQTAGIIHERHPQVELLVSDHINELLTTYEGHPVAELEAIEWEFYEHVEPPYETPFDLISRIKAFAREICETYPNGEVVAVTHGDIVVFSMAWAKGMEISGDFKKRAALQQDYPETASITSLQFADNDVDGDIPTMSYTIPWQT